MKWTGRKIRRAKQGTSTVEFAIVLPLLLTLLFSIIEFGFIFKDQLTLQQAAREGVRIAAVGKTTTEINDRIVGSATTLDPAQLTTALQYRVYNSGWSGWTTLGNQTGTAVTNDAPQGAQIRVQLTYTHALLTGPLFARLVGNPGSSTMTLQAQMVMRRE